MRDVLNEAAPRRLAVLKPLKLTIENWPDGKVDWLPAANHPADPDRGTRDIPFGRELWIERDDFMEDPPKKFFRLAPGREVRLRFAWLATCTDVVRDADGTVTELRGTIDPDSRGGAAPDGRKVRGTIHWVSAAHAVDAEVRLYDRLFSAEVPGSAGRDWLDDLNPDSLTAIGNAKLEPALADAATGETLQFERTGYFAPIPTAPPPARSSTAPSPCATVGRNRRGGRSARPVPDGHGPDGHGPGGHGMKRGKTKGAPANQERPPSGLPPGP